MKKKRGSNQKEQYYKLGLNDEIENIKTDVELSFRLLI